MEENTSMFTNKIIGILVAVVVLATVLVPICNAFSNNGGSEGTVVYNNPGSPMSEVDLSDHSKVYEWSADDDYELNKCLCVFTNSEGGLVILYYDDRYADEPYIASWSPGIGGDMFYEAKIAWEQENNMWQAYIKIGGGDEEWYPAISLSEDIPFYVYDINGTELFTVFLKEESMLETVRLNPDDEYQFVGVTSDITDGTEYRVATSSKISKNGSEVMVHIADNSDEFVEEDRYTLIPPTFQIADDGKITYVNPILTVDGEEYELSKTYEDRYWVYIGFVPKTVTIGGDSSDSDSGITGTIFQILPVFVLLAIIGSIAFMFIDRKETA